MAPNVRTAMEDLSPTMELFRSLDKLEVDRCIKLSKEATLKHDIARLREYPTTVDHSMYISFVRNQGAYACGMNAAAACLDIVYTMNFPPRFHPNLSVNRMIWAWRWPLECWPEDRPCGERAPGKIPGPGGATYNSSDEYLANVGCATEGTEPTNSDGVQWPTAAGDAECANYRLAVHPLNYVPTGDPAHPVVWNGAYPHSLKVDLNELKFWLKDGPVRLGVHGGRWGNNGHFVACVGYNDATGKLKILNSWGDDWGEDGFEYIDYSNLQNEVDSAAVYTVQAPAPVPCARISFKSQRRQDVYLWLSVDGPIKPTGPKGQLQDQSRNLLPTGKLHPGFFFPHYVKRIWPSGQRQDQSRNLSLTVTLPPGFVWPPSPKNRLYLDVYDCGSGGKITEFTVGHQGEYYYSGGIQQGPFDGGAIPAGAELLHGDRWCIPVPFEGQTILRLTVP